MSSTILSLSEFKEVFDPLLSAELDRHIARAKEFTVDKELPVLLSHLKEIALAGGKRIRPYAAYLMYATAKGSDATILEKLVGLEIFHVFALVHDDIIDRSNVRHGTATLHEFARRFAAGSPEKEAHVAQGFALLAGDLAFSWSRETFAKTESPKARTLFHDMIYAVVLGQMLDVKMMCQPNPSEAAILEKTFLKTAQYTFMYPFHIGAALADAYDTWSVWCNTVGASLGIAFQLQDDLLDIIGDQHTIGKKLLQDIAEGQHTIFTSYIQMHGTDQDREELDTFFGKDIDSDAVVSLQALFTRSGSIAHGKEVIGTEFTKVQNALAEVSMEDEARTAWEALLTRMEQRTV